MTRLTRIIIIAVALVTGLTASAQRVKDSSHIGLRAQFDLSKSSTMTNLIHWGPGLSVGAICYAPFGKLTYFNGGMLFNFDTFVYDGTAGATSAPRHYDGNLYLYGLSVPMEIGVKVFTNKNVKLSVYTGPRMYFNFKMKAKYTDTRGEISATSAKVDKTYYTTGGDIAWGAGIAIDFKKHWHAHVEGAIGLSYAALLDDVVPNENQQLKREHISVGLGYNF